MVLKQNIAFIAVLAVLAVVLVAVLAWTLGRVSSRSKVNGDRRTTLEELDKLRRQQPTKEHLAAVKEEHKRAEALDVTLKDALLTWWDATIYDEDKSPRQPGLFLGNLQQLSRQIRQYAESKGVMLGAQVEDLSFPELANDSPPAEVTIDMLKQQSMMKDVVMLLIYNGVESVDSVAWLGSERGGKLYNKYRVSVSFTCKYPTLAKFLKNLVDVEKALIGGHGRFPHNYLVVEALSYSAVDRKVAALASSSTTESDRRTRPTTGPAYPELRNLQPDYPSRGDVIAPAEHGRQPGARAERSTKEPQPTVGREPNYNILTVTMTISMVDFGEDITGKIEDLKKPQGESESAGTQTKTASSADN